jgi:hypothetical protein
VLLYLIQHGFRLLRLDIALVVEHAPHALGVEVAGPPGDDQGGANEPTPYLPMVNAMAPKAPIGATFMMKPTIANSTCEVFSIMSKTRATCRSACRMTSRLSRQLPTVGAVCGGERAAASVVAAITASARA